MIETAEDWSTSQVSLLAIAHCSTGADTIMSTRAEWDDESCLHRQDHLVAMIGFPGKSASVEQTLRMWSVHEHHQDQCLSSDTCKWRQNRECHNRDCAGKPVKSECSNLLIHNYKYSHWDAQIQDGQAWSFLWTRGTDACHVHCYYMSSFSGQSSTSPAISSCWHLIRPECLAFHRQCEDIQQELKRCFAAHEAKLETA